MTKDIKVHLQHIPANDLLHLTGEVNATTLDLEEAGAHPAGPLQYELAVGLSDGGLFATGSWSLPLQATCVCCLEPFQYQLSNTEFALQKELAGSELVDLTPEVREDIHLLLPMHPKCNLGGKQCPAQFPQRVVPSSKDSEVRSVWAALDQLTNPS